MAPGQPTAVATMLGSVDSIVTDAQGVYWIDLTSSNTPILGSCPLAGCPGGAATQFGGAAGELFSGPGLRQLAVLAGGAYFTGFGATSSPGVLYESPTTAGASAVTYLAGTDTQAVSLAVDGTTVYWADSAAQAIYRCAAGAACAWPAHVADTSSLNYTQLAGIAVDGGTVYVGGVSVTVGILAAPAAGGAATLLCENSMLGAPKAITDIVVSGTTVYFADGETGIYTCSTTSPGATTLGTFIQDAQGPTGLATDGTNLYWTDVGATPGTSAIVRCPLGTSCASPTPLAQGRNIGAWGASAAPLGIALSDTAVYWGEYDDATMSNRVMRVAK
jgi:hypothetical protein